MIGTGVANAKNPVVEATARKTLVSTFALDTSIHFRTPKFSALRLPTRPLPCSCPLSVVIVLSAAGSSSTSSRRGYATQAFPCLAQMFTGTACVQSGLQCMLCFNFDVYRSRSLGGAREAGEIGVPSNQVLIGKISVNRLVVVGGNGQRVGLAAGTRAREERVPKHRENARHD